MKTSQLFGGGRCVCVCVCVCERERERERDVVLFATKNRMLVQSSNNENFERKKKRRAIQP